MSDPRMDAEVLNVVRRPSRLRALAEVAANAESSADALDRIARVACRVLDVPVVLVNLVGADRQRFVGCGGPEPWASMREMPITGGFCPFALGADDAYALEDARTDPEHAGNPAVEQLGVVAYAGVPLRAAGDEPIGTLCAVDFEPRTWRQQDLGLLADLAAGVIAELQLLTATRLIAQHRARVRDLAGLSAALAPAENAGDVLEEVSRIVDRFDADTVWLSMIDGPAQALRTAAAAGAGSTPVARPADVQLTAPSPPAQVVHTGQPDFLTTRAEVRDRFAEILDVVPDAGSVAVLPLTAGSERLGVLGVCFAEERVLTGADRDYLTAVGALSGLALTRNRP